MNVVPPKGLATCTVDTETEVHAEVKIKYPCFHTSCTSFSNLFLQQTSMQIKKIHLHYCLHFFMRILFKNQAFIHVLFAFMKYAYSIINHV